MSLPTRFDPDARVAIRFDAGARPIAISRSSQRELVSVLEASGASSSGLN